jgi:hypothetical protein
MLFEECGQIFIFWDIPGRALNGFDVAM